MFSLGHPIPSLRASSWAALAHPSPGSSALPVHIPIFLQEYGESELTAVTVSQQAIESFALTVKEIAQMLQCFGTELAETELPEDMFSIERILALRTERYFQLKVPVPFALFFDIPVMWLFCTLSALSMHACSSLSP